MKKLHLFSLFFMIILICGQMAYGMQKHNKSSTGRSLETLSIHELIAAKKISCEQKMKEITCRMLFQQNILKKQQLLCFTIKHFPHPIFIQFLIDNGADINEKDNKGHHPFEYALHRGNEVIVDIFLHNSDLSLDTKNHNLCCHVAQSSPAICSAFFKKYCTEIDPQLFLKCALLGYYKKAYPQICANIYNWAHTCYQKCNPQNAYESAYVIINLQKHFYATCYNITLENNTEFINNRNYIHHQFKNCTLTLLHSILSQLKVQDQDIQKLFVNMHALQELIGKTHPEFDIFENPLSKNTLCPLFQNYFETTTIVPTHAELNALIKLAMHHWDDNKPMYRTLLNSYISRIYSYIRRIYTYCIEKKNILIEKEDVKNIQKIEKILRLLYTIILKKPTVRDADILYEIFRCIPELYNDFYESYITQKNLNPAMVQLTYALLNKQRPCPATFKIEDIRNKLVNYGIRAQVLTQLHNIPSQKIRVMFDTTSTPDKPIPLELKPYVIGHDCAQNILAFAGCNFTIDKNGKPFKLNNISKL